MRRFTVPSMLHGFVLHTAKRRVKAIVALIAVVMLGSLASALPASAANQPPTVHLGAKYCADKGVKNGTGKLKVANPNSNDLTYNYTVKSSAGTNTGTITVPANSTAKKLFRHLPSGSFTAKVKGGGTSVGPIKASIPVCPRVTVNHSPPDWKRYHEELNIWDHSQKSAMCKVTATKQEDQHVTVEGGYSLGVTALLQHHGTTKVNVYCDGHHRAHWSFTHS